MDFEKKVLYDTFEKMRPDLWRKCYPRVYEEPNCGKYYSPKELAYQLLAAAVRIDTEGVGGESQQVEIVWASKVANMRVPVYWIGHDMAQAIQQTVPPVEFDWVTTKLPLDSMVFMMPKGTLVHDDPKEGEAMFVSFVRVRAGDEIPSLSSGGPRFYNMLGDAFTVFAVTTNGALMHWTYSTREDCGLGKVNLAQLDNLIQAFASHDHSSHSMFSAHLTQADNRFMARVSHFVFGTLLMMLTKPNYVTHGALRKKAKTKPGLPPREFWSPNVVGLNYHIRREYQGGTHASPRLHWVRGAYKEQPYGEKSLLRKRIWIEPYLRGDDPE